MSAKIKKAGAKTAKALGVIFFLFLVVFNVQVATSNEHSSDINLLGLSLSIFTPSAVASEGGTATCEANCEAIWIMCMNDCDGICNFAGPYYLACIAGCYAGCSIGANDCLESCESAQV